MSLHRKYIENNVRASLTGSDIPTRRASALSRRGSLGEDSAYRRPLQGLPSQRRYRSGESRYGAEWRYTRCLSL
ncbi:hypothetical protein DPMN_139832 [Dreissena polymorpha]|uniref:Uncharacterized protein n=1 Tax=Dreissena polymorpha TaxID=45954 RepID=A0A9D4G707_DREPO|nr:hypothetical protein DPMN_139832 [Dreissena polymorpha]